MKSEKRLAKQKRRRRYRVRNQVRRAGTRHGRPRLSVFRSNRHMYAQIIDDASGRTLVSACTLEKEVAGSGQYAGNRDSAAQVGRKIAEKALETGIQEVVFDRGTYKYHGRVQVLADAARESGLKF